MERSKGSDAGRVSQQARFDIVYVDDMAAWLAQNCKELGVKRLHIDAREQTHTGSCRVEIDLEMQNA